MTTPIKIISTQKSNILEIRWVPNNVCNFKCRYCFPGAHNGDYKSPKDLDLVIKNFNYLLQRYKEKLGKNKVHLKIAGGEPSMWKGLETFVKEIKKENDVYLTLITNGSRTLRWWKQNGHLFDNVTLSYHIEQADLDHHINVADIMFGLGKKTTVVVLMDLLHWDKGVEDIEYMKKKSQYKWFIQATEVIEEDHCGNLQYLHTKEQKDFLRKGLKRIPNISWFIKNYKLLTNEIRIFESIATLENGKKIRARPQAYITENSNSFTGWDCNIGLENVYIHWDGNIQGSCTQPIFGLDYKYNILDEKFIEKFDPIFKSSICSISKCVCQPETHVSKCKR